MAKDYTSVVDEMADKHGVPRVYARAIYDIESASGKNVKTSSAGAKGHMQLMPGTAKQMGVADINDPVQNIEGGVKYYGQMLRQFKDPIVAAAAYNAGPGNVRKAGGVPNFPETQNYVRKFVQRVGPQQLIDVPQVVDKAAPKVKPAVVPDKAPVDLAAETESQFAALMANMGRKKRKHAMGILAGI